MSPLMSVTKLVLPPDYLQKQCGCLAAKLFKFVFELQLSALKNILH